MFKRDNYVKVVDTQGNYRFGYIAGAVLIPASKNWPPGLVSARAKAVELR